MPVLMNLRITLKKRGKIEKTFIFTLIFPKSEGEHTTRIERNSETSLERLSKKSSEVYPKRFFKFLTEQTLFINFTKVLKKLF